MREDKFRYILHADLDAFYASVEQRDNPELKGKPVAVGGPAESRGVVAAASYEAREYGVRSAMPMATAVRLCPELMRVSAHFDRYREVSRQIMELFREVTPLVEPLSMDEAYLDVSDTVAPGEVEEAARGLKERVLRVTKLAVTIGGGTSKSVAKIASQLGKPNGLLLVPVGEEPGFLSPLEVGMLWGVGPKTAESLERHEILTIGDVAERDEEWLRQNFGKRGPEMREQALGIDTSPVSPHRDTKSVSSETTMAADVEDEGELRGIVEELSREVSGSLQQKGLKGQTLSIKLRLSDFTTFTASDDAGDAHQRFRGDVPRGAGASEEGADAGPEVPAGGVGDEQLPRGVPAAVVGGGGGVGW